MTELNGQTLNILQENINNLRQLFPEVACEEKIDFDKLKQILGDYVEDDKERYSFTWNGKGKALRLSQTPSLGTLRPCIEDSKNWENTENVFIEGDNLEVLKLLQKSYHNKVKMIYIDPPYNTGSDFVYPDDYYDNLNNYLVITGQKNSDGKKNSTNTESNGRYHTDWLNMIYPRLRLARNLLTDDGVIFVSIDEHELSNLRTVMMEIYGEDNWIADIVWQGGSKNDEQFFAISHEYVLVYAKNIELLSLAGGKWQEKKEGIDEIYNAFDKIKEKFPGNFIEQTKALKSWYSSLPENSPSKEHSHYSSVDKKGIYFPDNLSGPRFGQYRYDVIHPLTGKICKEPSRGWVYPELVMRDKIKEDIIHFGIDETTVPCRKTYLKEHETKRPRSVIYKDGRAASGVVENLLGQPKIFTNPKDHEILSKFIELCTNSNDTILDFFSGSSSTAHAVFELNKNRDSKRKFVLVQIAEPCDVNSEAYKAGYRNICEIGKDRIRRVGDKVNAEQEITNSQLTIDDKEKKPVDIGFKVFKLDTSNLKKWQPDYDNLEQTLLDNIGNFIDGRNELDVVYEIMLKMGLDLTYPVTETVVGEKKYYSVGFGALMMCLDDDITTDLADSMVQLYKEQQPETWKVVFKDNGFKSDSSKTNIKEILKCAGLEEDAFTTI